MTKDNFQKPIDPAEIPRSFTIISDTKEKMPWSFNSSSVLGVEYTHLKTGDYSVKGLEHLLCIERKRSVAELAGNIHEKRFFKELERMQEFKYKYILLESTMQHVLDYPHMENLPDSIKQKIKINGAYILKCFNRIQVKYNVNIVYCGTTFNAQWVAVNIMREVATLHANDIK
jgi:ERCC4-type nuclease